MWELSGESSIGSSQSLHCQFGLFLCPGPMVVFEGHILVHVTIMSLSASLLKKPSHLEWAEISREDLSPANRVPFLHRQNGRWLCQVLLSSKEGYWQTSGTVRNFRNSQELQEGFRLQQAASFHSKCPCCLRHVSGRGRQKIRSMSWTVCKAQKRSWPNIFPYVPDHSTLGGSSPEKCWCESVHTTVPGTQVSPQCGSQIQQSCRKPLEFLYLG